jgi:hypothetical protein
VGLAEDSPTYGIIMSDVAPLVALVTGSLICGLVSPYYAVIPLLACIAYPSADPVVVVTVSTIIVAVVGGALQIVTIWRS